MRTSSGSPMSSHTQRRLLQARSADYAAGAGTGEKVLRSLWIVACISGLVIGTACSESEWLASVDTPVSSTTLTVEPAPSTTSPPPAPLSKEQAAERYLAIVEPYNVALEALEQVVNGRQPVEALPTQAESVAVANDRHVQELKATAWPADVQPAVDELVAESEQAQIYWLQASQTREEVIAAAVSAGENDGGAAADAIRSLLGLADYDEDEYS